MNVPRHKPVARGVADLMYVGDVPVEQPGLPLVAKIGIGLAVAWWLLRGR